MALGVMAISLATLLASRDAAIQHAHETSRNVTAVLATNIARTIETSDNSLRTLIAAEGEDSTVKRAVGAGLKEWISFAAYVAAVPLAFVSPYISIAIYLIISIVWIVPDRRFEPKGSP